MDEVFKALADATRRELLDRLRAENGQTLGELCERMAMSRQAVTKHLALLEAANLVATVRRGREKLHYLNPAPIGEIYDRWIGKYEQAQIAAFADLKRALEEKDDGETRARLRQHRQDDPRRGCGRRSDPEFTPRYWYGTRLEFDWQEGSPILFRKPEGMGEPDTGTVLVADRPTTLPSPGTFPMATSPRRRICG